MLGERIVEPFPAIEDVESLLSLPEPCGGLTVRRVKSAGLRIVTEGDALWPASSSSYLSVKYVTSRSFMLHPPPPALLYSKSSASSARTPDTSHTFGRPNPTMTSPKHPRRLAPSPSSSPSAAILHSRRLSRYSQVERALRSAVEVCSSELSPQELQIRALEKATALLSDQARDAQACAARLRARLEGTDSKSLSPDELKTLQHEYWMEEHRSAARKHQSEKTRDLLTKLSSPIREVPPPLSAIPSSTHQETNLARFLRLSPTHVDLTHSRSPSTSPNLLGRRKTISQMRPLRLRSSAMDFALRTPIQERPRRSKSLDGTHTRRNSNSTDATYVAEDASEQTALALPLGSLKTPPSPDSSRTDGFVRIEGSVSRRPRHVLLAEVGDVTIPDYAVDLIEDFAASPVSVTTTLSPVFAPESPTTVGSASTPSVVSPVSPFTQSRSHQFRLKAPSLGAIEDGFSRASSSMPDFSDFTLGERPSTTEPSYGRGNGSRTGDRSPPPRPSSRAGSILDRLRSLPTEASSPTANSSTSPSSRPTTPFLHRRPPTANATVRASATQSLLLPMRKFGSMRGVTNPSLVTVPEAEPIERPQSSMSSYGFPSPETILEHRMADGEGTTGSKGRFAMALFTRRRFNSASSDSVATGNGRGEDREGTRGVLVRMRKKLSNTFGSVQK
ncbi:hypothetical protein GSI_08042 [Ganoderma sinense ZZ0214-1]|uniref:Uncharacterized protein n=1 Tax=Ganoderma sinense ZZ0214-1 TaxID=1077348 RepID=A0A2G8S7W4_9APHY|nr:hypothetical protein GSI_08042 [Ganoderma sinense ZZ0214-1]